MAEKNTVGLTPDGSSNLERVLDSGWFSTELDVCRVAMSLALQRGVISQPQEMNGLTTKYNLGSFDRDGLVRTLLRSRNALSAEGVAETAERLLHAGLAILAEELEVEGALLSDVLEGSVNAN